MKTIRSTHKSLKQNAQFNVWLEATDRWGTEKVAQFHLTNRRTFMAARRDVAKVHKLAEEFIDEYQGECTVRWFIHRAGGHIEEQGLVAWIN